MGLQKAFQKWQKKKKKANLLAARFCAIMVEGVLYPSTQTSSLYGEPAAHEAGLHRSPPLGESVWYEVRPQGTQIGIHF